MEVHVAEDFSRDPVVHLDTAAVPNLDEDVLAQELHEFRRFLVLDVDIGCPDPVRVPGLTLDGVEEHDFAHGQIGVAEGKARVRPTVSIGRCRDNNTN